LKSINYKLRINKKENSDKNPNIEKFKIKFFLYNILFKNYSELLKCLDSKLEFIFIQLYEIMIMFLEDYSISLGNK
jgi:hypothetical protein